MKTLFKLLFLFFFINTIHAQKGYKVIYDSPKKPKAFTMYCFDNVVYYSKEDAKKKTFVDFNKKKIITTLVFNDTLLKKELDFADLPKPEFLSKPETILGYQCKYAKYLYFSNTVEVWYTEKAKAKGSPYSKFLPTPKALVLKVKVNGSVRLTAAKIEKIKTLKRTYNIANAKLITEAEYAEKIIQSRYYRLPIFKKAQINFDPKTPNLVGKTLKSDTVYHLLNGNLILKKVKLTPEMQKSPYVFAKVTCQSKGDAYDRSGGLYILPVNDKTSELDVLLNDLKDVKKATTFIEVMRFFTSFGAGHFNNLNKINNYNWANEVVYKQDITAVFPENLKELWVAVNIGNYDKGGYAVDVELDFYPEEPGENPVDNRYVQNLFSTTDLLGTHPNAFGKIFREKDLEYTFEVPSGVNNFELQYTSTGHGGWGTGDEFTHRLNEVFVDGKKVFSVIPWRNDCATYRELSPASGNFSSGLSSSDFSRSNWCPGMITPPYVISLPNLKPGKHTMRVKIDQGPDTDEGHNSWWVTCILTGKNIKSK